MVTNVNEPVWSSGLRALTGGGNGALVLIPVDQDTFDVTVEVAAATTAQVEVTSDSYEDILGIQERPVRYAQVAINDLGGSGELRMNAAAGQDFTDDGWAVGDTFEVVSHQIPDFGPGVPPTSIADVQIFTVTSVAALVLAFSEDPAFSLAEGDIVVAQSRAAIAEDNLNWAQTGLDVVGVGADQFTVTGATAARVIASAGVGNIDYKFVGRLQSVIRPLPFVANVESRPFSGPPAGATGIELAVDSAPVWAEETEAGTYGNQRFATMTLSGVDFDVLGVKQYDSVNFSGHSVTGNTGLHKVRRVTGDKLQMYNPLKGVAGTDDARVRLGQYVSASGAIVTLADYDELMLQLLGATDSYLKFQDAVPTTGNDILDSGQAARTDWNIVHAGTTLVLGPFGASQAYELGPTAPAGNIISDGATPVPAASTLFSMGGWFRADGLEVGTLMSKSDDGFPTSVLADIELTIDGGGFVEGKFKAADLADPGAWVAATAYAQGDRVRPTSDDESVHEAEVGGTSAALLAGFQDGDYGGALTGGTATGLANDATVYTATVEVNGGGPQAIAITGDQAQDYDALIVELDADTTGASWLLNGGELRCTSAATGETSAIDTVDTDLFSTLADFVSFNTAVPGDGEPTFAAEGATVVDATVTWRNVDDDRSTFHNLILSGTYEANVWFFLVVVREADGTWRLYKDGVLVDTVAVAADDTTPGSFGSPKPHEFSVDMGPAATENWQIQGVDAFNDMDGDFAYAFVADGVALTAAGVAALHDTASDIGLN